jgi:hypothetical protein
LHPKQVRYQAAPRPDPSEGRGMLGDGTNDRQAERGHNGR